MNDKVAPEDKTYVDDNDELLSDFSELFTDDSARQQAPGSGVADEALDELDAFLDDFEQDLELPDARQARAAESGIGKADLDLDVGLDGEVFAEEPLLDVEEGEVAAPAPVDKLLELDASMDEAEPSLSATAEVPAAAPAPGQMVPPAAVALSRPQVAGALILFALSVLLSLAALWMGIGLSTQVETLNQHVSELQQRLLAQSRRSTTAPQAGLAEQLNRLDERVNELAVIVEGPVGHLQQSSEQALDALNIRVTRLEQQPLAAPATNPTPAPVASPETQPQTASGGGWVINLLSVTSARAANSELERLRKMGIRADKQAVSQEGKTWYRLRVTGFDSYEGAKAYIDTVQHQAGVASAWVGRE